MKAIEPTTSVELHSQGEEGRTSERTHRTSIRPHTIACGS